MVNKKLNIRFHNPNTKDETVDYISLIFIEACKVKMDKIFTSKTDSKTVQEGGSENKLDITSDFR